MKVKTLLDGTGQGVDSGTIEGFSFCVICPIKFTIHWCKNISGYKTEKCLFYDLLHGIYGTKANIVIPYQYDSLRACSSKGENRSQTIDEINLNNDGGSGINKAVDPENQDCHQVNDCHDSHTENDVGAVTLVLYH